MTQATTPDWTVGRLLDWTRGFLAEKRIDEPRLSAELLLAHALACRKIDLYTRFEQRPAPPQVAAFRELVRRAAAQEPIAYLVGHKEFYSIDLLVSPAVLIPRPETELLVEAAVMHCRAAGHERCDVLDLGTGSGCVAIAVARLVPGAAVVATDVSPDALDVARRNVERLALAERVRLAVADGPDLPAELRPAAGFDLILCNPPYIAEPHRAALPANVRDYEPALALFGGADGLSLIRRLAAGAGALLAPSGRLLLEVADGQADAVAALFTETGWRHERTTPDAAGIPRMLAFGTAA